jgi:hypothetical protein
MSARAAADRLPGMGSAAVHPVPHPVYNEDDPTTQTFVCPLCCDLAVKDPSITHCQHIFCRDCIVTALTRQAECPIDRGSLRPNQVSSISGPLKQIWQSIKVNCPKCKVWSGPLETYETHVKSCQLWDEEKIKKLQDELASTSLSNRTLTKELATVRNKLEKALKEKNRLQNDLFGVTVERNTAKAAQEATLRILTITNNELAKVKAQQSRQVVAAAVSAPRPPPSTKKAEEASSLSPRSPILAAAYSTMTRLAETSSSHETPTTATLPRNSTTTSTTSSRTSSRDDTPRPIAMPRRVVRAIRPTAAAGTSQFPPPDERVTVDFEIST